MITQQWDVQTALCMSGKWILVRTDETRKLNGYIQLPRNEKSFV